MIYTLVKDNIVVNVIVAEQEFIDAHPELYDLAIPSLEHEWHPSPGDVFDAETAEFEVYRPAIIDEVGQVVQPETLVVDEADTPEERLAWHQRILSFLRLR